MCVNDPMDGKMMDSWSHKCLAPIMSPDEGDVDNWKTTSKQPGYVCL